MKSVNNLKTNCDSICAGVLQKSHHFNRENGTLPPSCANNQAPPFLDGERQAAVVGEGMRSGESVIAYSTFRNSVWAGEAGDRVCAQGGGGQGRFSGADRQADRQRCACVSKGSEWSLGGWG